MLSTTYQKLEQLYKLEDLNLNSDEAVQLCVNKIIEDRTKLKIDYYLTNHIWKENK